ncbi:MAG TPA: sulfurtransferase [Dehalococcoidia bacterium]|nr:sulfurtransferase [Dehalococcoidia bacterium]
MSALVTPAWLKTRLGDPSLRILESSIEKATYDAAHIPGALWVEPHGDLLRNGDESSGFPPTPEQYAALMRRLGVTPDTTVVWYGDRHSVYAMRGFWTMDYFRHPAPVHVLQGGRERWLREGRAVTSEVESPPSASYPVPSAVDDTDAATWQDVRDAIGRAGSVVLDVRSPEEHDGRLVRAARGGHVPGAVNIEWTDAAAGDNVLRPADELRRMYEDAGVTPDREVITHCQLGIRAVHTWFVLKHVLGYPHVRNYAGSWQEWGNRPDSPIE